MKKIFFTLILCGQIFLNSSCTVQKEIVKEIHHQNKPSDTNSDSGNGGGGSTGWGGGNGVCNSKDDQKTCRPLESFIFNIYENSVYKNIVKPIITEIFIKFPKFGADLHHILTNRLWYSIPGPLDGINSKNLGVPFTSDQLAIQNFFSVFISQDNFDKMTVNDSALLIMHELVMGVYLLNYTSNKDKCLADSVQLTLALKESDYRAARRKCTENYPVDIGYEKFVLNESDYAKVRELTYFIFQNYNALTVVEIEDYLSSNNFLRYKKTND